jgi:hypothetical protein
VAICLTRISYTCLLVSGDLASVVEEGGELSGRCSYGVVDLVRSTCVIDLVSKDLD